MGLSKDLANRVIRGALQPLVRFALKNGMRIHDLTECCKQEMVKAAQEQIMSLGEEITLSRICVMTGIHRMEVRRIEQPKVSPKESVSITIKIIGQWQGHPAYCTKAGAPKILIIDGKGSEFYQLVESVSKDFNPQTVLFELERIGAVKRDGKKLQLIKAEYLPPENVGHGLAVLTSDVQDLFSAGEENIFDSPDIPNLHRRTEFDRIRPDALPEVRKWMVHEGVEFHKRAREYLSQFDLDLNPDASITDRGATVVMGTFSRTRR